MLVVSTSCKENKQNIAVDNGYIITLKNLKSWANNRKARIIKVENRKRVVVDSIIVNDGGGVFKGDIKLSGKHYITFDNKSGVIEFILSNETIDIIVNNETPKLSIINNSPQNNVITTYTNESEYLRKYISTLKAKNAGFIKLKDTLSINKIKKSYDSITEVGINFDKTFIKNNPSKVFSAIILERLTLSKTIKKSEAKLLFKELKNDAINSIAAKKLEPILKD